MIDLSKYIPHSKSVEEVFSDLSVSEVGLSQEEVEKRISEFGLNKLKEEKGYSITKLIIEQFSSFLVLLLIGAGILSFAVGETIDAIAILLIVVINGVLGFVQEFKAEQSLEALKKIESPEATVIRDGKEQIVAAEMLVPGDVIVLAEGAKAPADARLTETHVLYVDESMLTGESIPVEKSVEKLSSQTALAERTNLVFSGSLVTKGRGRAIVVFTGEQTEIGKIAKEIQAADEGQTPLQEALAHLGRLLGGVSLAAVVPGLIVGYFTGRELLEMILVAISLAVAAIPEGLPIVVTIALALGIRRMADVDVLIRKLSTAETLGGTDVICTDKTGTLTHNQMTIRKIYAPQVGVYDVTGGGYNVEGEITFSKTLTDELELETDAEPEGQEENILKSAVLCSDATLETGDPTERAFFVAYEKMQKDSGELTSKYKRVDEIPFDSAEKFMAVTVEKDDDYVAIVKGAYTRITEMAGLEGKSLKEISEVNDYLASQGLRVLAVAKKQISDTKEMSELSGYEFLGLVAMEDPPRASVKPAINVAHEAGVRVIMLTGDHKNTAIAIAKQIGLVPSEQAHEDEIVALSGLELDEMSDREFADVIGYVNVFARVSPHHKLRVLTALQERGLSVGMTGDGVNDAPAVKRADIGMAVGAGTDLTKGVSDMIILDNDFSSITDGIEEGRRIFFNIKKFIRLLISTNFDEIALIFVTILLGMPLPFIPLQILWLNLATDSLPALALTSDIAEPGIMKQKPYNPQKQIMSGVLPFSVLVSVIAFTATFSLFLLSLNYWGHSVEHARTLVFTATVIFEFCLAFSVRSTRSAFAVGIFSNKFLVFSIVIGLLGQLLLIYHPLAQEVFETVPMSLNDWLITTAFAISGFAVIEILKEVKHRIPSIGRFIPIG